MNHSQPVLKCLIFDCEGTLFETHPSGQFHIFPGIMNLLNALNDEHYILTIATTHRRKVIDHVLGQKGLLDLFVSIQTGDFHPLKPNPSALEAITKETGIEKEKMLMIGDTEVDCQMAKHYDIASVIVDWNNVKTKKNLWDSDYSEATYIAETPEDLKTIIETHFSS